MSSTASAPLQQGAPADFEVDVTLHKDVDITAAPAVVTWQNLSGEPQSLGGVTFDIHHNVRSGKAFFRLRTAVALKAVTPRSRKTYVYVFIEPEHINSMALSEIPDANTDTERAWQLLGTDVVCIHFNMDKPPTLVTPRISLAPRSNAAGITLDHLYNLVREDQFTVYAKIPSRTLPASQLSLICEATSNHGLKSIDAHVNPAHLYGGQGGRVVHGDLSALGGASFVSEQVSGSATMAVTSDASQEDPMGHPPSYDEVPPGPPGPPGPPLQMANPLKRRRRSSSSPPAVESVDRKYIEDICTNLVEGRLATLRRDIAAQLEDMKSELLDHIDDRVSELRTDVREDTGAMIEDEYYSVRIELKDHVDEQINDLEERILDTMSNARLTLDLNK